MIDQEKLNTLATAWFQKSRNKLNKTKTEYQTAVGGEDSLYRYLVMHKEDPEKYEKEKERLERNIAERRLCIQVLNMILEKKK